MSRGKIKPGAVKRERKFSFDYYNSRFYGNPQASLISDI